MQRHLNKSRALHPDLLFDLATLSGLRSLMPEEFLSNFHDKNLASKVTASKGLLMKYP